jgi:hypothetical protein
MPAPGAALTEELEGNIALIARPELRYSILSASPVSGPRTNAVAARWPSVRAIDDLRQPAL